MVLGHVIHSGSTCGTSAVTWKNSNVIHGGLWMFLLRKMALVVCCISNSIWNFCSRGSRAKSLRRAFFLRKKTVNLPMHFLPALSQIVSRKYVQKEVLIEWHFPFQEYADAFSIICRRWFCIKEERCRSA